MIVRAPATQRKAASAPRPKTDLACAEVILGDPNKYGTTSLMATWAKIQKERENANEKG
jgi:hypothetical protein